MGKREENARFQILTRGGESQNQRDNARRQSGALTHAASDKSDTMSYSTYF